jgi:Zn-dependent M28 family amino/carboxypeptidase
VRLWFLSQRRLSFFSLDDFGGADPIAKRNIFPNPHLRVEPCAGNLSEGQLPVWTEMRLLKTFEFGSGRVRSLDRFAAVAKGRYRTSMKISWLLLAIFFYAAASLLGNDELKERLQPALEAITPDGLLAHIKVLASDEFEGRSPGTKGEDLSVKYIADQFKKIGLKPGNPDGTYTQEVPLAGIKSEPRMSFVIGDKTMDLKYPDDFVASSARLQPEIKIEKSNLVFVGYGVVAPEYAWDDYKNVDVRGKTLLMLIGDPPVPDPKDPSKLDDKMFKGKAMTYYGRWTYKYEIAAQKGATAAIIIHETEPAAYPWQVVKSSWGKENFELDNPNKNMDAVSARSWITLDAAKKLLADCGQNFDAVKKSAVTKDFQPVMLNAKTSIEIKQQIRSFKSHNVIGKLEGSDPKLNGEYVIYTAHWDHLGRHPELQGDQIFNGAIDNASGVASVIELAGAFSKLNPPPKHSVLFIATTAEEAGLLGAKFYAEHPLYPLEKTLADINLDSMNVWGKARDIEDLSLGFSTLDDLLSAAAKGQGRSAIPDSRPDKGKIYRADNFEFSKVGLPSLYIGKGEHLLSRLETAPLRSDEFDSTDYHQVTDEVHPDWDLSGAVQDVQLLFEVGYEVANGDKFPEWKPRSEFKAKRDSMLRK